MSKQPHHKMGAESMGGGNSGRRGGVDPRLQTSAGMANKAPSDRKKSASKPPSRTIYGKKAA